MIASGPRRQRHPGLSLDEKADLLRAQQEGFLRLRGHDARRRRLARAWLLETRRRGLAFVTAERVDARFGWSRVHLELHPRQSLTVRRWEMLQRLLPGGDWTRQGHVIDLWDCPHRCVKVVAGALATLLGLPGHPEEGPPVPRWQEGLAMCTLPDGMEADLGFGEIVYVRELPNLEGHGVVYRHRRDPLAPVHLGRFRLLRTDEAEAVIDRLL